MVALVYLFWLLLWRLVERGRRTVVEEPAPHYIKPGLHFDAGPLGLDLYRLLCIFFGDRRVMSIVLASEEKLSEAPLGHGLIRILHDTHMELEVLRILISSAVTLRIAFDQYSGSLLDPDLKDRTCGLLWPKWPNKKKEPLTVREACNKIIHAAKIQRDIANPSPYGNPNNPDAYVQPHIYLYGEKNNQDWRAKLSIIDFVKRGTAVWCVLNQ
jgi:hypothetical protein